MQQTTMKLHPSSLNSTSNKHRRREQWKNQPARQDLPLAESLAMASSAKQTKKPIPRHGTARKTGLSAASHHRCWCCHCQMPSANPPLFMPRLGLGLGPGPGRINGAGGAPVGRPRARAPRPRVRCARLPLGTSELCFAGRPPPC